MRRNRRPTHPRRSWRCAAALLVGAAAAAQTPTVPIGDLASAIGQPVPFVPANGSWFLADATWSGAESRLLPRPQQSDLLLMPPGLAVAGCFGSGALAAVLERLASVAVAAEGTGENGASLTIATGMRGAATRGLARLRQNLPPRIQCRVGLVRRVAGAQVDLLGEQCDLVPGVTRILGAPELGSAVVDYEVEIAGGSSTANPVVVATVHGTALLLRVSLSPRGDRAVAECLFRHSDRMPVEPIEPRHPGFGKPDRLATQAVTLGGAFEFVNGAVAGLQWTRPDGDSFALEIQARWTPVPAAPRDEDMFYDSLNGDLIEFGAADCRYDEELPAVAEPPADSMATHEDRLRPARIVFGADAAAARAAAQHWFDELPIPSTLELHAFDVAKGTAVTAATVASAEIKQVFATSMPLLAGRKMLLRDTLEQRYLADWDVEVANQSRIPDPKVRGMRTGLTLVAAADNSGVELGGELASFDGFGEHTGPISVAIAAGGTPGSDKHPGLPPMLLPEDVVRIEQPRVRVLPLNWRLPFDKEGVAIGRKIAPQFGAGRELVVLARLRH